MKEEEGLNQEIEHVRRELNESIQGREDLSELCEKSEQLDRLLEQYLELEHEEEDSSEKG